ncbi:hypothetical protein HDU67_005029, partial [Dinochytrium kinnereticum]
MDADDGEFTSADTFAMDDASSAAMLALFPHLRSSPPPIDPALDPLLTSASTEDMTRPATLPRIGSTDRFSVPPSPPLTVSLSDIYCENLPAPNHISYEPPQHLYTSMSNPASPYSSATWSSESDPDSDEEIDILSVSSPPRIENSTSHQQTPKSEESATATYQRRERKAASAARRFNYLKQYGGLPRSITGASSPTSSLSNRSSTGSIRSGSRYKTNTLLSRALANKYTSPSGSSGSGRRTAAAAERLAKATKRMTIGGEEMAGEEDAERKALPSPPFSLDSDSESVASNGSAAFAAVPSASSSSTTPETSDVKAARRPAAQSASSKPTPARSIGF